MLYREYQRKIFKLAQRRDAIMKYRVLYCILLGITVLALAAFLFLRGMIIDPVSLSSADVTYGEALDCHTKVLFGRATYEYADASGEEWSRTAPTLPGNYRVRAVSRRSFGASQVTEPVAFRIHPKEITVSAKEQSLVYGDLPSAQASLVKGDRFVSSEFTFADHQSAQTTVTPVLSSLCIRNEKGLDVTRAYQITPEAKEVQILPKPIRVITQGATKIYDGTPLTATGIYTDCTLPYADRLEAQAYTGTQTDAGSAPNTATYRILGENGADMTALYEITFEAGTLQVLPRPIVIQTESASKMYDGTALREAAYAQISGMGLLSGHRTVRLSEGSLTNAGSCENRIEIAVLEGNVGEPSVDVSKNYEISYLYGTLTVLPRPLLIRTENATKTYDALPLSNPAYTVGAESLLLEGHRIEPVSFASITNVRESGARNEITLAVKDASGVDQTQNYQISWEYGILTVLPREITVNTNSAQRTYNGDTLRMISYGFSNESQIMAGHWVEADESSAASIRDVGVVVNSMSFRVMSDSGDQTSNYLIHAVYGELKITPCPIKVTIRDAEKIYDGTPLTSQAYLLETILPVGHHLELTTTGSRTEPGSASNAWSDFRVYEMLLGGDGPRDVTANFVLAEAQSGTLTVHRLPITVTTDKATFTYDAEKHTATGFQTVDTLLPAGHTVHLVNALPVGPDVGSYLNEQTYCVLLDDGTNVTDFFDITVINGAIDILPRLISVHTGNGSFVYDGTYHSAPTFRAEGLLVANGHYHTVKLLSEMRIKNTWESGENRLEIDIVDAEGVSVMKNYVIMWDYGTLLVKPRILLLRTGSRTEVYNGNGITCLNFELEHDDLVYPYPALVGNDRAEVLTPTVLQDCGSVANKLTLRFVDETGADVTANYSITSEEYGILTVTPRHISVRVKDASHVYDGKAFTSNDYEVTSALGLVSGHWLSLTASASITLPGKTQNGVSEYQIKDSATGRDVSSNYVIDEIESGWLTVTPRPVTVTAGSAQKEYDGTPLTCTDYDDLAGEYGILRGHRLQLTVVGAQTEIGSSSNRILSYAVLDENGEDITFCYDLTVLDGTLTVTAIRIDIFALSEQKTYDGTPLTVQDLWVFGGELLEGHELCFTVSGSRTEVGLTVADIHVWVVDENGTDVSEIYDLAVIGGEIEILPISITVTTQTDKKYEDGTPLTNSDAWISQGMLLEGHTIEIVVDGSCASVGTVDNTIESIVIRDANGEDVTNCYEITEQLGKLTIEEKIDD